LTIIRQDYHFVCGHVRRKVTEMKEIEAELRAAMTVFDRERRRERNRRQRQRIVSCCKQMVAFLFSHVGLAAMVVAYSIMGGFLFQALEAPAEHRVRLEIVLVRDEKIKEIWQLAKDMALSAPTTAAAPKSSISRGRGSGSNTREPLPVTTSAASGEFEDGEDEATRWRRLNFTAKVGEIFKSFQVVIRQAVKDQGWDGNDSTDLSQLQWSFAGALLYAVTVITTIGWHFTFILDSEQICVFNRNVLETDKRVRCLLMFDLFGFLIDVCHSQLISIVQRCMRKSLLQIKKNNWLANIGKIYCKSLLK
jgi:hypothetical protein